MKAVPQGGHLTGHLAGVAAMPRAGVKLAREMWLVAALLAVPLAMMRLPLLAVPPTSDALGFYGLVAAELGRSWSASGVLMALWVHPPGVELLGALGFWIGGGRFEVGQALFLLVNTTLPIAVYGCARALALPVCVAGPAALGAALWPNSFFTAAQILPDALVATAGAWAIFFSLRGRPLLAASAAGLALLAKEAGLAFGLGIGVATLLRMSSVGKEEGSKRMLLAFFVPLTLFLLWVLVVLWVFTGAEETYGLDKHLQFAQRQLASPLAFAKRLGLVLWQAAGIDGKILESLAALSLGMAGLAHPGRRLAREPAVLAAALGMPVTLAALLLQGGLTGPWAMNRYQVPAGLCVTLVVISVLAWGGARAGRRGSPS